MALLTATISGRLFDPSGTQALSLEVTLRPVSTTGVTKSSTEDVILVQEVDPKPRTAADGTLTVTIPRLPQLGLTGKSWSASFRDLSPEPEDEPIPPLVFTLTTATTWNALIAAART